MFRVSATLRIAFGLSCLVVSVLLASRTLGLAQDEWAAVIRGRSALAEAVALHCSSVVGRSSPIRLRDDLQAFVDRNPEVLSAGLRLDSGRLIVQVNEHARQWEQTDRRTVDSHIYVPILDTDQVWGTLEILFQPYRAAGLAGWMKDPLTGQTAFVAICTLAAFFVYLRRMLSHLDPSRVIPERVRSAFDTLAEGVVVLDEHGRIVLANRAFSAMVELDPDSLQGFALDAFPWALSEELDGVEPWRDALAIERTQIGAVVMLQSAAGKSRSFRVNTAPIRSADGVHRGILVSFDDITQLEERKAQLRETLEVLHESREKIRRQNRELTVLATLDPLTACLNRRAFFDKAESLWAAARQHGAALSCVLLDIDHFKAVNDLHGHAAGDEVLRGVSRCLRENAGPQDLVCRYGGEEFCILLPVQPLEEALQVAERLRTAVAAEMFADLNVTVSLGAATVSDGCKDLQSLLDLADKCLYYAKRKGRNRVAEPAHLPDDFQMQQGEQPSAGAVEDQEIPFHAVTALVSALSYRDASTAEHSRRVADLCVAIADGWLSVRQTYVLEIAALLHDIGKIGVPDSILLKPGALSEQEWRIMGMHDSIGVDIINTTFASAELSEIVRTHHAWYDGNSRDPELPNGESISLAARILAVADAYDAMVSNRVYRRGLTPAQAAAELQRCAGRQFDPQVVDRLLRLIDLGHLHRPSVHRGVTKQSALRIGLQIEHLVDAVESNDVATLRTLVRRLKATAAEADLSSIMQVAEDLDAAAANGETQVADLVDRISELLGLCRATQKAYLDGISVPEAPTDASTASAQ